MGSLRALLLSLALAACCVLAYGAKRKYPWVRKELRSLSPKEYELFVTGLGTMLSVSTEQGQKLYGPKYKNYEYFIVKHAVAAQDPRGDQAHSGPQFMTFHRAYLIELEASLLSVVPELGGMPYLNLVHDLKGGKYYKTSEWAYGPKYAGAQNCASGEEFNCQVTDGVFAYREVGKYNARLYNSTSWIYNGSSTGLQRARNDFNTNTYVTRFPTANLVNIEFTFGKFANASKFWMNNITGMAAGTSYNFTQADFQRCLNASSFKNWLEWTYCIDYASFVFYFDEGPEWTRYVTSQSGGLHTMIHLVTGGLSADGVLGDMFDVTCSPNEPLLFMTHHANADRSNRIWMANAQKHNATLARNDVMWGYPASNATYPVGTHPGCYLHDVITSNFPFTDIFDPPKPKGFTHFDVLDRSRPGKLYRYAEDD